MENLVQTGSTSSSLRARPLASRRSVRTVGWTGRKSCRAIAPGLTGSEKTLAKVGFCSVIAEEICNLVQYPGFVRAC